MRTPRRSRWKGVSMLVASRMLTPFPGVTEWVNLCCSGSDGEDLLRPGSLDLPGPRSPPGAQWRHRRRAPRLAEPPRRLAPPPDLLPVPPGRQPQHRSGAFYFYVYLYLPAHVAPCVSVHYVLALRDRRFQTDGVAAGADGTHPECGLRCNRRHMWRHQTGTLGSARCF